MSRTLSGFIYTVLPLYLTTILFYFPNIVSYFLLCCRQNYTLSQRKCYYFTRVYSLVMIVVCALIQIGVAWLYWYRFCGYCRPKKDDDNCQERAKKYANTTYTFSCNYYSNLQEICQIQCLNDAVATTVWSVLQVFFSTYFYVVAKSFLLEMTSPVPTSDQQL